MTELTPWAVGGLCLAAFTGGTIDAMAGGGGLITLPALLMAGLPPPLALGTNKGQSVFGSGMALVQFHRAGLIRLRQVRVAFPLGFLGSLAGAALVVWLDPRVLKPLVLGLLVIVAAVLAFRSPSSAREDGPLPAAGSRFPHPAWKVALVAGGIGAYDGFFGPGTGTFLIAAFVAWLGDSYVQASADAKVVNFASNLAAVGLFAGHGALLWSVALPMGIAQVAGGWWGVRLALRGGDRWIRSVTFVVVLALAGKLAFDLY